MSESERQVYITQAQLEAIQDAVGDVKQRVYLQSMGIEPLVQDKSVRAMQEAVQHMQEFIASMETIQRIAGCAEQELGEVSKDMLEIAHDESC